MATQSSAKARLAKKYTALHEGKAPASIRAVKVAAPPKELIELGRVSDVVYQKVTTEPGKPPSYHHEFEMHARPLLSHDERGKLYFSEGQYTVTSEGITDMKSRKRHGSKYTFGASRANKGHKRHHKGKSRHALAARSRRNDGSGIPGVSKDAMKWGERAARSVATAGIYELISGIALNHLPWLRDRTGSQRNFIQGGTAIVLGFATRTRYPNAALGFVVSGGVNVVEGGLEAAAITHYMDSMFARAVETLAPTAMAPAPTPTGTQSAPTDTSAPAQGLKVVGRGVNRAALPDGARAGMPAGNRARTAEECAR